MDLMNRVLKQYLDLLFIILIYDILILFLKWDRASDSSKSYSAISQELLDILLSSANVSLVTVGRFP